MPDFGDEMGEKLVQGITRFIEGRMNDAWRDHKAKVAEAAKEEAKRSEQLAAEAAQAQAAADIVDGGGKSEGIVGELDRAAAEQADKDVVSFKYDVGKAELDLPDEQSASDSVYQLYDLVQEKLEAAGCGGLLAWDFNEPDQTLFCQVASSSVGKFRECLKGAQEELSDLANERRAQAEEYRRMEEAGEFLSADRTKFDVDMSEFFSGGEQDYQEAYQAVRGFMNKVEIGPDVQIDRDGSKLSFTLYTDKVEAVDEAAAFLARSGKASCDAGEAGIGETLREASDNMAFKHRKTLQVSINGGPSVSRTVDVPATRLDDFQSSVRDLAVLMNGSAVVKGNTLSVSMQDAAAARTSVKRIDQILARQAERAQGSCEALSNFKDPRIATDLLEHAKQASIDLTSGKTPPPPGMPTGRAAGANVISRS